MNIAGYTRISVDIEQDRDNTSIENQKSIIKEYVAEHFPQASLTLYEDRDRSGYTFEQREGYQKMRPKLFDGGLNVLIVKDFSRFSRRNSLGLLELEKLRDAGVRIISIGDGIDYPTRDDWMLIQFKFLMNEMPITDTSKKIKAIIQHRQKNGEWICAVPYGYRMVNTKEMSYEIDPYAAQVVREIFRLYNNGWGYKKIANHLTDNGVPTPRANEIARKEANGQKTWRKSKAEWSIASVSGILANDFYIGTLRQGKYTRRGINGTDMRVGENEQIVIENAHTPIIDTKTFFYTQETLKKRSQGNYRGERKYATDYSGFLFCGDCGAPMFSMSRPDLKPAYTCGTYHRRGLKGCTSHHIRVDKLDELLKYYIRTVRDHSEAMIEQLRAAVKQQPEREQDIGNAIESLERQLADSKAQLRAMYKRKLIDTMGKSSDETAIIDEAYTELEKELTGRIAGLEQQININIDCRNQLLQATRAAKTVSDVFDSILAKPKLDKQDIALIVERITVYEDRIDVQLKADVDGMLSKGFDTWYHDTQIEQNTKNHRIKVFRVHVISNGDPLEIYTSRDGEVIFKKYSLMGGVDEFAAQLCETLNKTTGLTVAVTDRDSVIAAAGSARRELIGRHISAELEQIMEQRAIYRADGSRSVCVTEAPDRCRASIAAPILSAGDALGLVLFVESDGEASVVGDTEYKLAQTISAFLGRHMET